MTLTTSERLSKAAGLLEDVYELVNGYATEDDLASLTAIERHVRALANAADYAEGNE